MNIKLNWTIGEIQKNFLSTKIIHYSILIAFIFQNESYSGKIQETFLSAKKLYTMQC